MKSSARTSHTLKLTKKLQTAILPVYNAYWERYLKGDVKGIASLLSEDYTQVGSAETEVFSTKKGAVKFLHDTIDQVAGKLEMRNRHTRLEQQGKLILVHELCDVYVLTGVAWIFYSKFRASTLMQKVRGQWKIVHQHGSFPDTRTGEGENVATKKIAEENQRLREAVKRRTVELEQRNLELTIEAALEKVRAVAMGMKHAADMLEICRTISHELASLKVKNIRNVQTAIFYPQRGTYMNYEYYAKHKKTFITETTYTDNRIHNAFAQKMLKGEGEIFTTHINGKKVKDWIAYQKTTNVFIDKYLNTAASLSYYWYSLGPVAMGISSYSPLTKDELNLFKRFRNVFELAYRRYVDIEQALAQALEARIEASLEKVRAQAMSMRTTLELKIVGERIFAELKSLGFADIRNTEILINNDSKESVLSHYYSDYGVSGTIEVLYNDHPIVKKWVNEMKKGNDAFAEVIITKKEIAAWRKYREHIGYLPDPKLDTAKSVYYYSYSTGLGALSVSSFAPVTETQLAVLKRFRNVFGLAYRRYTDVARAETHAWESKIELSLERVRARANAMHKSDELVEAADVVFQQLKELGIESIRTGIATFDAVKETVTVWSRAHADQPLTKILGVVPKKSHPFFAGCFDAWKAKKKFFSMEFAGKDVVRYYKVMSSILSYPAKKVHNSKEVFYTFFFPEGSVNIVRRERLTDEELSIMERFASVFGSMYRRFLDLQRAEAQAKEAQIETALEKIRSRTMGMQKSVELKEVIRVVYDQFLQLNIFVEHTGFIIDYKARDDMHIWLADRHEVPYEVTIPYFDSPHWNSFREAKKRGKAFFANRLTFEEKNKFYMDLFALFPVPENAKEYYFGCPGLAISTVLMENVGLYIENFSGVPYSDEENATLMRFGTVFQQTYTRFLDLQKAEAQAREARIEAALEKVRARTMAMQKSGELQDVATLLFGQMKMLNIDTGSCGFNIWDKKEKSTTAWMTSAEGGLQQPFTLPHTESPVYREVYKAMERGDDFALIEVRGRGLKEHFDYLATLPGIGDVIRQLRETGYQFPDTIVYHLAFFNQGYLSFHLHDHHPETQEIFKRFAKVFEQTYTRFLDLKKAEAQARESQIEAALERIRASAMAMHTSGEIENVVHILREQMGLLGQPELETCVISLFEEDADNLFSWYAFRPPAVSNGEIITGTTSIPWKASTLTSEMISAYRSGKKEHTIEADGAKAAELGRVLAKSDQRIARYAMETPSERLWYHLTFLAGGTLLMVSHRPPSEESKSLQRRAASVFDLAYRRYLDLKKAEAQTREARIEAALEKVRGKAMAMHSTKDLSATVSAAFSELRKLGMETIRTGVALYSKDRPAPVYYASTTTEQNDAVAVTGSPDPSRHPCLALQYDAWSTQQNYFPVLRGTELESYYQVLSLEPFPVKDGTKPFQHDEYGYYLPFSGGNFYAWSLKPFLENDIAILSRFRTIVDLTFRRYFEIHKAEAQAREAQIEAALERVRSRTLAMQKSDELAETASLLFRQLIALGIAPNRLYIAIIKNDGGDVEFWITDEDGSKVNSAFATNLLKNRSLKKMHDGWRNAKQSITIDMQGEELEEYFAYLHSLNVPFKDGLSQTRRVQTVAYFSRGFIGIASPVELPEETKTLLERFAAVLNLTFTRFSDLKLAEAQAHQAHLDLIQLQAEKQRAEDALTELSATQAQLVQQEKLASLGQLTAGIAHEIKNPLNFVNNFSSVSVELIDEVMGEIAKKPAEGDSDIPQLLTDVKTNLAKIIEHGTRADGIVKSMLQHSRGGTGKKEPTDLNALVKEYVNLAFHGMRAAKNPINVEIALDLDPAAGVVPLIANDFSRVIINLSQNAFDAMREKLTGSKSYRARLTVRTHKEGDTIAIEVEDNGPGIPDAIKDKILQPFFTTKKGTQGTGLGLSITNEIIKAHGGSLSIESSGAAGTVFKVSIPLSNMQTSE